MTLVVTPSAENAIPDAAGTRRHSFPSHPVDRHVGRAVATYRLERNLSQKDLGKALDVSFQHIQKYEKGLNRISASKLWEISLFLGVGLERFFPSAAGVECVDGINAGGVSAKPISLHTIDIGRLAIRLDPHRQRLVLALMRSLAG